MGLLLRRRRKQIGLTQADLGTALHVSTQQVQKYECGHDRISAASLYKAAQLLGVPVTYFFDEDELPPAATCQERVCLDLVEAYLRIKNRERRKALLALVQSLSDT
ncbi:helix-turn-helix transcriptional regulator [Nitratireductor sp. GISD-1A_MAKvit]|uniref:helix-turn-helix domain-containing protein n=1 Tax=Nitratireductor sp. GISD-1A_MAKvit TaxID=3234198 RepID=UPI00346569F2